MKRVFCIPVLLLCAALLPAGGAAEASAPFVFPSVGENRLFSEAFCLSMREDAPFEWNEALLPLLQFFSGEEGQFIRSAAEMGEVYEVNQISFYPDGSAVVSLRLSEGMYGALCSYDLFRALIPREGEMEYTYTSDGEEVTLLGRENVTLAMDREAGTLSRAFLGKTETLSVPAPVPDRALEAPAFTVLRDLSYGSDPLQVMDVYLPDTPAPGEGRGAFIEVYGGSWTGGTKEDVAAEAERYAAEGYIVMAMNMRNARYNTARKKTEVTVYDMLNDIQASVRELKALSDQNGWNLTQCAFRGTSSGANLSLLYCYSRNADIPWFDTEEVLPARFVVNVVGPVDMHDSAWFGDERWPEKDRTLMTAEGAGPAYALLLTGAANEGDGTEERTEEAVCSMSPVWYAQNGNAVPTLMGYSARDLIQNPNNGLILKAVLDEAGVRNDLYTFENSIHGYYADPETAEEFLQKSLEYARTYFVP